MIGNQDSFPFYFSHRERFQITLLQAFEYEQKEETPGKLEEFFESTKGVFKTEKVKQWVADLYEKRDSSKSDSDTP